MEQIIKNPNEVRRLWRQARAATDRAYAAIERAERLTAIDRSVRDGTYPDAGVPLIGAMAAPKFRDDLVAAPPVADTRNDRTGEDDEPFQSDFGLLNH